MKILEFIYRINSFMAIFDYYLKKILLTLAHGLQKFTQKSCDIVGLAPYSPIEEFVYYSCVYFGAIVDMFLDLPYLIQLCFVLIFLSYIFKKIIKLIKKKLKL